MTHLNVAVRVRPLSQREISANVIPVVEVGGNVVSITNLKVPEHYAGDSRERVRRFSFDHCFGATATQEQLFSAVNDIISEAIKKKYHSCVLAYGQSSSGKTHTMMGFQEQLGLTPRLCERIFEYLKESQTDEDEGGRETDCHRDDRKEREKVTISYLEIYNERVNDLLGNPEAPSGALRVREHPTRGAYVQGLRECGASDPETLSGYLKIGNKRRRVSATSINPQSSRSHSVVTLKCLGGVRVTLVDLAGSERSGRVRTKSTFWEGANINKSLVALGNVISSLADQSTKSKGYKKRFIPYRDSVLTWLLKDTLGGNSQTLMIATVSPSSACYNETVNTLRFGHRAKQIVAKPVPNEDPKQKVIRDLKLEIVKLRNLLNYCQANAIESELTFAKIDASTNTEPELKPDFKYDFLNAFLSKKRFENPPKIYSTAKLIPIMDITTEEEEKPLVKLRRTYSVLSEKDAKSAKRYGSYEGLSSAKGERPPKKSAPTALRKRSIDRPSTLTKVEAKVDSIRKATLKPRSEIVAAVTQRLYSKLNRKEVATETDEVLKESKGTMARVRLQDITQRALRYYKRKTVEVQTESDPVLRVKDVSIDTDDLKVEVMEVKHMSSSTEEVKFRSIGLSCSLIGFESSMDSSLNGLRLTATCGVQVEESDLREIKNPQNLLSFTKYLKTKETHTKNNLPNAIYTSSVNIHVNHNYLDSNQKEEENISEDSLDLEDNLQNLSFPTPDLISNHNSLEQDKMNFASLSDIQTPHQVYESKVFDNQKEFLPKSEIIPDLNQAKVSISATFAPEINTLSSNEKAFPMKNFNPNFSRISKSIESEENPENRVIINEPIILKSIMKQHYESSNSSDSSDFSLDTFENVQDSLNYHKKVRFPPKENRKDSRIFEAMTNFLKEASSLMANLAHVAHKLDKPDEAQINLNEITKKINKKSSSRKKKRTFENTSSQTSPKKTNSVVKIENETEELPVNKFENLVKESCDRLDELCNKRRSGKRDLKQEKSDTLDESILHKFPQPFSIADWNDFQRLQVQEDSSLDSNPTYSDYGSLPRRKPQRKRRTFLSPSEYLRQLASMRKQIVDTSRDELLNDHRLGFE